jgi:hypothetical protein
MCPDGKNSDVTKQGLDTWVNSELKAASEQASAPGRKDRLKVLSTLVAAARRPAAASEP